jgi:hypothetical protein
MNLFQRPRSSGGTCGSKTNGIHCSGPPGHPHRGLHRQARAARETWHNCALAYLVVRPI